MELLNIVFQIDLAQTHAPSEQYVARSIATGATEIDTTIEPYADLTAGEKVEYDELKAVYDSFLPAGKNAALIIIQIALSESGSQKRAVICYLDGTDMIRVFKNYADLTGGEKVKYDAFIVQVNGKVPA